MTYRSIFGGAASFYARYRHKCHGKIVNVLKSEFQLDGTGRLLDLGAGSGQSSIPYIKLFREIIAVEVNPEMMAEGKKKLAEMNIKNIKYHNSAAEDIEESLGLFQLTICGSSFHWMDKTKVLGKLEGLIEPSGGIAIFSSIGGVTGLWNSLEPIDIKIKRIIQRYLGEKRKAGKEEIYSQDQKSFTDYLSESQFNQFKEYSIPISYTQSIDEYLGLLFSTSFANQELFGEEIKNFENEVRSCLKSEFPEGNLTRRENLYLCIAKRGRMGKKRIK
ncbi:class I SAM-dependent methyltransferase [Candidatus Lokiarchaeum ossiferum]|uniref:class I SAM-dependent methyltransferase n=1 Tax=Candidatus Lokiarchaeum ossiferum TaxID=2951803 RepID=UPI00352D3149